MTYWHHTSVPDWDLKAAEVAAMMLDSFSGRLGVIKSRVVCAISTEAYAVLVA